MDFSPNARDVAPPRPDGTVDRTGAAWLLLVLLVALAGSAAPGAVRALDPAAPAVDVRPVRIDLNRADPADLSALPGVGPSLAARIAAEREREPFRAVEDLRRVPGIGPSLAGRITPHTTLAPPSPNE